MERHEARMVSDAQDPTPTPTHLLMVCGECQRDACGLQQALIVGREQPGQAADDPVLHHARDVGLLDGEVGQSGRAAGLDPAQEFEGDLRCEVWVGITARAAEVGVRLKVRLE